MWKPYKEREIDYSTGEDVPDQAEEKNKEKRAYKADLLEWLITHQKRDRKRLTQGWRNKQHKALNELWVMHTPRTQIIETVQEYEEADWYTGDKPDFRSIVSKFEKKT